MKKILEFNDYLFDILFENKIELSFTLTDRLYQLLKDIVHPIAKSIIDLDEENYLNDKITLLDYDDNDYTKFTYTIPTKLIDTIHSITNKDKEEIKEELKGKSSRFIFRMIEKYDEEGILNKNRTSTTINKVVNKLFPNKFLPSGDPGNDLESFKEVVVSKRKEMDKAFERFKIVENDDILKYYHYSSYYIDDEQTSKTLIQSCMRYDSSQQYLKFYSENDGVKLVVLFSDKNPDKIVGRALLWDIEYINDEEVDRKFMDRIYTIYIEDVSLFKSYAKKNGWLNKKHQNMHSNEIIEDLKNNTSGSWELKTTNTFDSSYTYPYMDTMKYYYFNDEYLSNIENYDDYYYTLESTVGDYVSNEGIYVEYYGRNFNEDDLIYCNLGDEYRLPDDAFWIESEDEYATEDYIDRHFVWSDYDDEYIRDDMYVYSDYLGSNIYSEDSVEVFLEESASYEDYHKIPEHFVDFVYLKHLKNFIAYFVDSGPHFEDKDILYFHKNDKDYFIKAYSTKHKKDIYLHRIWDKDKIVKKDGKYYVFDGDDKEIDKITGQYRLFDSYINKFENLILEGISEGELPLVISSKLWELIHNIGKKHKISSKLLQYNRDNENSEFTLVDISDKKDLLEISNSIKIIEFLKNKLGKDNLNYNDFMIYFVYAENKWDISRYKVKIGRLIKKLFGDIFPESGKPGEDIESFVNMYKSEYELIYNRNIIFEIVSGKDIIKWYDYENYEKVSSTLSQSCMADGCEDFLNFYAINSPEKVNLLVLYKDDSKTEISARALVWNLDEPKGRKFLDRVYYTFDYQNDLFRSYAIENGWFYKKTLTNDIFDGLTDEKCYDNFLIKNIKTQRYYPYVDTMYCLYQDSKILSRKSIGEIKEYPFILNSTDGQVSNGYWSDFYKKYIHTFDEKYIDCFLLVEEDEFGNMYDNKRLKEDATFFEYYNTYAPNDKFTEDDIIQTTFGQQYKVLKEDAVWLKHYNAYTTDNYVDYNMYYSNYYKEYVDKKDAVSTYDDDIIFYSKSEIVYKTEEDAENNTKGVIIPEEELGKITYEKNGKHILKN